MAGNTSIAKTIYEDYQRVMVDEYTGDGGLAKNASLNSPIGLAFNAAGDLFIVDAGNGVVRRCATDVLTQ